MRRCRRWSWTRRERSGRAGGSLAPGARPGARTCSRASVPAIGPGALEGLTWATGHHRNGVLLAPLTAELLAGLLAGTGAALEPDSLLDACAPARFTRGRSAAAVGAPS